SVDKTLTWSNSGLAYESHMFSPSANNTQIAISNANANPSVGSPFTILGVTNPPGPWDQPWVRATSVGGVDHIYVTHNQFFTAPQTATVLSSVDGGVNYNFTVLERANPGAGQDAPSVRAAVNGNTVYAGFIRWNTANGNGTF